MGAVDLQGGGHAGMHDCIKMFVGVEFVMCVSIVIFFIERKNDDDGILARAPRGDKL